MKIQTEQSKALDFNKQRKGKGLLFDLARVAKVSDREHIKILTPKQMFQRLPIAFAHKKADIASENLLNEIRQIIYSLYRAKEITKKVYKNIIISNEL